MQTKAILIAYAFILLVSASTPKEAGGYVIPDDVQIAADKYADEYGISPEILIATMRYESCFVSTVSNGNCKGLMQVNDVVHKERMERLGVEDIYDIDGNIHVAADYIAELYEQYGDYGIVMGLYHGERKAISNGSKGIYSSYTKKVLKLAAELEEEKGITDGN